MTHLARGLLLAVLSVGLWHPAVAQPDAYPSKPIRMVVCCAGFPDAVARLLADYMSTETKQSVIVDTRPGANGILGADIVAKAPADGYTMFIGTNSSHAANQSLYKSLPYDYVKDFTPISGISQGALMVVVNPALPVHSMADLTALARKEPGRLNYGWASSSGHLAVEQYKQIMDLKITDVPYKTVPQATTDLLGGRLDFSFTDLVVASSLVSAGKLRALAVTSPARLPTMPDLPTVQEAGVPGYAMTFWLGAWLPAGAPPAVVQKLNALITAALATPRVTDFLTKVGSVPFPTTSDELMRYEIAEHDKWHRIIVAAGIQPE
jgi:tripartite-type tricarboxylate transporter receptor subunit TctC